MVSWILLAIGLSCAAFLAWRDEYREKSKLLATQWKARDECLNKAVDLLKKHKIFLLPIQAVYRARVYKLQSNDDVLWISSELEKHGHGNPFENLDEIVLPSERLEFFQWGRKLSEVDLSAGGDFIAAIQAWPEHKGRPRPQDIYRILTPQMGYFTAAFGEESKQQLPPFDD